MTLPRLSVRRRGGNAPVNGFRPDLVAESERLPVFGRRQSEEELYVGLPRPAKRARGCDAADCRRWADLVTCDGSRGEVALCMEHWCDHELRRPAP